MSETGASSTSAAEPTVARQRIVALHRRGSDPGATGHRLARWLFLRSLGAIYLIAVVSLWVQVDGLIGPNGLLPVGEHLARVRESFGATGYWIQPTLCWLGAGSGALHALCSVGVALALLLIVGVASPIVLFGLWVVYLSLSVAGQTFLGFQWDALLLETGLVAIFLAPARLRPRLPGNEPPPSAVGLWLLRLLLFKLMFLSGAVKLISGDETWRELTALEFHYFTQPLPIWTSWYAHQLPAELQKLSVLVMFLIEIGAPFLIFFPRLPRLVGCFALIGLQLCIAITGNYGFFNLLSIALCIVLLDDALLGRMLPARWRQRPRQSGEEDRERRRRLRSVARFAALVPAGLILFTSALVTVRELERSRPREGLGGIAGRVLDWSSRNVTSRADPLLRYCDPFRSVNGYGLFRVMTTTRPEIVIEGSADGREWREYGFFWKPGDPARRPRFVAPHQPRLDWQIWFAALNPPRSRAWLEPLILRLLQGSPEVLGLLAENPFPERPPRYVRLAYYDYRFTTPDERAETGDWWSREQVSYLTGPISLETFRRPGEPTSH